MLVGGLGVIQYSIITSARARGAGSGQPGSHAARVSGKASGLPFVLLVCVFAMLCVCQLWHATFVVFCMCYVHVFSLLCMYCSVIC